MSQQRKLLLRMQRPKEAADASETTVDMSDDELASAPADEATDSAAHPAD